MGTVEARLVAVERYEVHGQPAWRLVWRPEGGAEDDARTAHLGTEAVHDDPRPGDRVAIALLMGQASEVRLLGRDGDSA